MEVSMMAKLCALMTLSILKWKKSVKLLEFLWTDSFKMLKDNYLTFMVVLKLKESKQEMVENMLWIWWDLVQEILTLKTLNTMNVVQLDQN